MHTKPVPVLAEPSRRRWLGFAAGAAAAAAALPLSAQAQVSLVNRPVRVVVPFAPGGATDVLARVLGERMAQDFGQPVVVENKTGATGLLAGEMVVRSVPDGTTVLLGTTSAMLTNKYLYKKTAYDPLTDLKPLVRVCLAPIALVVASDVPVQDMKQFMAWIKGNRSKLSYGSYGIGSHAHLVCATLSKIADADMLHVAYRGEAPMLQGMLTGEIKIAVGSMVGMKSLIDTGKLRALAVTGPLRVPLLPEVPTFLQAGYDRDALAVAGWLAIAGPKDMPDATARHWAKIANRAIASRQGTARIIAAGFVPVDDDTPESFARLWAKEGPMWGALFEAAGVQPA